MGRRFVELSLPRGEDPLLLLLYLAGARHELPDSIATCPDGYPTQHLLPVCVEELMYDAYLGSVVRVLVVLDDEAINELCLCKDSLTPRRQIWFRVLRDRLDEHYPGWAQEDSSPATRT